MKLLSSWRRSSALFACLAFGLVSSVSASILDPTPPDPTPDAYNDGPVLFTHPPFSGNPVECGAGSGGTAGLGYPITVSIDGQPNGIYPILSGGVQVGTITATQTPGGIDFSSTIPIDAVIMKGGDMANVYPYVKPPTPPVVAGVDWNARSYPGAQSSDVDVNFPTGSSHVDFCLNPRPTAQKSATASWKRFTDWQITKSVSPDSITMFDGDTHEVEYTVTATPTTRGEYRVAGTITVNDPFNSGWSVAEVVDTMQFTGNATQFSLQWDGAGPGLDTMSCSDPAGSVILSCSYEFVLQSTTYPFLLSATGGVNAAGITATKSGQTYVFATTASFSIPANPAQSFGDSFSVDDSMLGGNPDHVFTLGGSYVWTYPRTFTCGTDEGQRNNTATGGWSTGPSTNGSASDSASVTVACETVSISKTATTRYTRDYAWEPEKWIVVSEADARLVSRDDCLPDPIASGDYAGYFLCNDAAIRLNPGDSYETVYKLTGTQTIADDHSYAVSGSINVSWPAGLTPDFDPATPSDTLHFTDATGGVQAVPLTCGAQGATSLGCTYDAVLPRDAVPGYNLASITRVKKCYDADGIATDCGPMSYDSNQAALTYGSPSVENNKCVAVSDLFNGIVGLNLGNTFSWIVNANACASFSQFVTGDINPDPLVLQSLDIFASWLLPVNTGPGLSCQFMVPNVLRLSDNGGDEALVTVNVTQLCDEEIILGCTYTQGYWKTHVNYAPKPQFSKKRDAAWDLIDGAGSANENATFFLSGMSYIKVMWTPPRGNAYYNLAHQYIAAKLNVLDGADDSDVAAGLAQAEAWFSAYPPSHGFWRKNQAVIALAGQFGAFNEGEIGPGHCSVSPATLKASGR